MIFVRLLIGKTVLVDRLNFMQVSVEAKVLGMNPRCLRFDLTPPSLFIGTILFLIDLLIIFLEKFLLSLSKLLSSEFSFISI